MKYFCLLILLTGAVSLGNAQIIDQSITEEQVATLTKTNTDTMTERVEKSEEEWKDILTSKEFKILRKAGTEIPYTNEYHNKKEKGVYHCAGCNTPLFNSDTKYSSGTGWPSFYDPIDKQRIGYKEDKSLFMKRTEVVCAICDGHLGHVFDDGPEPTGLRYCLNSAALDFEPADSTNME